MGDELTLGQTLDTNTRWLSSRLLELGVVPLEHATVPDDQSAQATTILRLARAADLLIVTGGLGPTADDLTRSALAQAMGDTLVEDTLALAQIEAWFGARGRAMTPLNRTQALRPSRAVTIPNLNGTAPGLHGVIDSGRPCDVYCLPGPPREMMPMFESHVMPRIILPAGRTVRTRVLHCFGIGESDLAQRLGDLMDRGHNPLVGTTASGGVVSCRIRYQGPLPPAQADDAIDAVERQIRDAAGAFIFGAGDQTLAQIVVTLLKNQQATLGAVESCTGGMLGQAITEVPGSSAVFLGGLVTYSNTLKQQLVGVDAALLAPDGPGAVSAETARAMAVGGLKTLSVQHCLAITGIAGPDGGIPARPPRPAKPVGTVFIARASAPAIPGAGGVSPPVGCDVRRFFMSGDRHSIRDWSSKCALAMLWQHLVGLPPMKLVRQVD